MIVPTDVAYQDTKRVKMRGTPLPPPFQVLAHWIAARYDVKVLNILLDTIEPNGRPRLHIVLEWAEEKATFMDEQGNFDATKQRQVRDQFASIAGESVTRQIDIARLLVIFSAFEPVARVEANWRVADHEIEELKRTLDDPDLWEIRKHFESVTFFFYTKAQARANEASGALERLGQAYGQVTAPYDEFGYLAKRRITVRLDSKENFDSAYNSNWFYYDRDH